MSARAGYVNMRLLEQFLHIRYVPKSHALVHIFFLILNVTSQRENICRQLKLDNKRI